MSFHQIVHTYRKCGLYGGGAGFGVLSSDRDFPKQNEFGELLYSYAAPDLDTVNPEYSERIIALMPVSYTYRYKGGSCAVSRSSCLGRDAEGDMNHISHSILFSDEDSGVYPCEFIGSPSFLTAAAADAVNSVSGVGYMGAPVLQTGTEVTINKVMKFLSVPGNFDIFRSMLWALMHKDETKRRIIICDEQENTVLWISALNYALPLSYAKKVSFSTYAYDPRTADVDICGVVAKCTAYDRSFYENDGFFVFDLTTGECFDPGVYQEDVDFFAFLEETMLHNYALLKVFHAYIEQFCDTDKVTPALCPAYLMSRASNCYTDTGDAFRAVSEAEFDRIAEYSGRHARYGGKLLLFEAMCSVSEAILGFGNSYITKVLSYMSAVYKDASYILQNGFRSLAVDSVPIAMIARDITSGSFSAFFENIKKLTAFCDIKIVDELMSEKSRKALLWVAGYQHVEWKADFIVSLISEYIHSHASSYECLMPAEKIGGFLSSVMKERYACGTDKAASDHALSLFVDDVNRFCTVEENLEATTDGMKDGLAIQVNLTTAFSEQAAAHMKERRRELFNFLAAAEKYDLMRATLHQMITSYDVKETSQLVSEHYSEYFTASSEYAERYLPETLDEYYGNYRSKKPENIKDAQELVFGILLSEKLVTDISDEAVSGLLSGIKLNKPNKEAEKAINNICEYECVIRGKELTGKLLCLAFGAVVAGINNRKDYHDAKPNLSSITEKEQIDLTCLTEHEAETYQAWMLPIFAENAEAEEIPYIYGLFRMNVEQTKEFTSCFCDEWLSQSKRASDYSDFCTFLHFVFTALGADELQTVSEKVHKLNSKKLEQLKLDAETAFSKDFALKEKFNRMIEMQPKKKGFLGLFRK
ncbi:MAG: hypothetical protein IJT49_01830 [Clostridia bacterium]|nr:hypothetical protein [Clostridia bacterium]